MSLYSLFIEPWTWGDWMWRGTLVASLVGVVCALLGCFLYLRRLALMSDALAHVALPGLVGAFLLTGSTGPAAMFLGALGSGLLTTGLVEGIRRAGHTRDDAAIGVVFTALFALGVILLTAFASDADLDASCVLFGDVLGVPTHAVWTLGGLTLAVIAAIVALWRPLQLATFDPDTARLLGVPVGALHLGLMGFVSITTVASFQAVGAILVVAALITPAATAHLLTRRLHAMLLVAAGHGALSALLGMYLSVWLNCSTAGAMVCVGALLYLAALLWSRYVRRIAA